jgi:hypothetical protein
MRRGAAGTPVALQQAMKVVWLVISGSQRYALFAEEETQTLKKCVLCVWDNIVRGANKLVG